MKVRQIVAEAALKARAEGRKQGLEELEAMAKGLPGYEINDACDGQNSRGCMADIDHHDKGRFVGRDDLLAAIRALKEMA